MEKHQKNLPKRPSKKFFRRFRKLKRRFVFGIMPIGINTLLVADCSYLGRLMNNKIINGFALHHKKEKVMLC